MSNLAPSFRLTYSTMFDPPAGMHERFEAALARVRPSLGRDHPIYVDGKARLASSTFEVHSPIDTGLTVGRFQSGSAADIDAAVSPRGAPTPPGRARRGPNASRCCAAPPG